MEPDGTTRVVEYIADDHGFRAVVKKLGTPIHPSPAHVVHEAAPIVAAPSPAPAPVPEPIIVVERQPVLYDGHDAYNGHYQNYVPGLSGYAEAPAPIEIPKVVIPKIYQPYEPSAAPQYQEAPYFPVQRQVDERVEYHGFTGNDDDDSAYTKYGQEEAGEKENRGYDGYSFEESRPQLVSIPYKFAAEYQKPIVYFLQQKY